MFHNRSTAGLHVQNIGEKQWTLQLYLIQNMMKVIYAKSKRNDMIQVSDVTWTAKNHNNLV